MATRKLAKKVTNNKSCKEITDLILDYLNDKLTPTIKREFMQHLRFCPDCVSFLNTYKKTVAATGTIKPEEVPPTVRENVLAFLRKRIYRSGKGFYSL
jgi:hypothetical protein